MITQYSYPLPITHTIPICFIHITLSLHRVKCFKHIPNLIRLSVSSVIIGEFTMDSIIGTTWPC
jgi:hypothetical protein